MQYVIGSSVYLEIHPTDINGVAIDVTNCAVTFTLPDGTTAAGTVVHAGTGDYTCTYLPAQTGRYTYVWGPSPLAYDGDFTVRAAGTLAVSLPDAKNHLNITATTNDAELIDFILRAQAAIEKKTGPLTPTTYTRRVGRTGECVETFNVPVVPAISLTTVRSVAGATVPTAVLDITPAGVVQGLVWPYPFYGRYDITYLAGRTSVEPDLYLATLEMLRHLWETQRRKDVRTVGRQPDDNTGTAYSYPNRVLELISAYVTDGFA